MFNSILVTLTGVTEVFKEYFSGTSLRGDGMAFVKWLKGSVYCSFPGSNRSQKGQGELHGFIAYI